MDCWDIGIPTPHLNKKSAEYAALFLPTGVIIPIPWVKPILTNPIPTFRMNDGRPVAFPLPGEATPAFLLKERFNDEDYTPAPNATYKKK